MSRHLWLATCLLLTSSLAIAAPQTVNLKNGGSITGEVTKTPDGYVVRQANGIEVSLRESQVASVTEPTDFASEYQKKLAQIDVKSAEAHIGLAQWAEDQGQLECARKELQSALQIDATNEKAKLLLRRVEGRLNRPATPAAPAGAATVAPATQVSTSFPNASKELVSDDDIYRIRLAEYKPNEPVSVRLTNKVVDRFVTCNRGLGDFTDRDFEKKFRALPATEQMQYMIDNTTTDDVDIRKDIQIQDDPSFMTEFRRVWPTIEQTCATAQCHGGGRPVGGFKLYRGPGKNVDYTNFLILSAFVKGDNRMVDRTRPDKSMLLQFGLPKDIAQTPHPKQISAFTNQDDAKYRRIMQWINSLNGPEQPAYRISYRPPTYMKLDLGGSGGSSLLDRDLKPAATAPARR